MCMGGSKPEAPPPPPPPPQMAKMPESAELSRKRKKGMGVADNSEIAGGTLLTNAGGAAGNTMIGASTLLGGGTK